MCVCVGVSPKPPIQERQAQEAKILGGMGVAAGGFFPPEGGVYGDAVPLQPFEDGAWCVLGPPDLGWECGQAPGQTLLKFWVPEGSSVK